MMCAMLKLSDRRKALEVSERERDESLETVLKFFASKLVIACNARVQ